MIGKGSVLQVEWAPSVRGTLAETQAEGMTAHELAHEMRFASRSHCGRLDINELYVTRGFYGGAIYIDIPAEVLGLQPRADGQGSLHIKRRLVMCRNMVAIPGQSHAHYGMARVL